MSFRIHNLFHVSAFSVSAQKTASSFDRKVNDLAQRALKHIENVFKRLFYETRATELQISSETIPTAGSIPIIATPILTPTTPHNSATLSLHIPLTAKDITDNPYEANLVYQALFLETLDKAAHTALDGALLECARSIIESFPRNRAFTTETRTLVSKHMKSFSKLSSGQRFALISSLRIFKETYNSSSEDSMLHSDRTGQKAIDQYNRMLCFLDPSFQRQAKTIRTQITENKTPEELRSFKEQWKQSKIEACPPFLFPEENKSDSGAVFMWRSPSLGMTLSADPDFVDAIRTRYPSFKPEVQDETYEQEQPSISHEQKIATLLKNIGHSETSIEEIEAEEKTSAEQFTTTLKSIQHVVENSQLLRNSSSTPPSFKPIITTEQNQDSETTPLLKKAVNLKNSIDQNSDLQKSVRLLGNLATSSDTFTKFMLLCRKESLLYSKEGQERTAIELSSLAALLEKAMTLGKRMNDLHKLHALLSSQNHT